VRLEGLDQLKKSTSSGLKPSTFRLVAPILQVGATGIEEEDILKENLIYLSLLY
jgi:hypothetical protein